MREGVEKDEGGKGEESKREFRSGESMTYSFWEGGWRGGIEKDKD